MVEILLRKLPLPMAERFLLQLESDRDDVVEAALAGGTIERYLDQMEAGNTEVKKNSKKLNLGLQATSIRIQNLIFYY